MDTYGLSRTGLRSRSLPAAKAAYLKGDSKALKQAHNLGKSKLYEPAHQSQNGRDIWKKNGKGIIFGGNLATLMVCSMVCAVEGAGLHPSVFLYVGLIGVVTGTLFVSFADFMNQTHDRELISWERQREAWECENYLEGELEEMVELYEQKGVTKEDAQTVISILSKYRELFIDIMMVQELGLLEPIYTPLSHALSTGVSFFVCGLFPLLPAIALRFFKLSPCLIPISLLKLTVLFSFLPLLGVGTLKSYWTTGHNYWKLALYEIINLSLATVTSYYTAYLLKEYFIF